MVYPYSNNWTRHLWKIPMAGAVLALIGILTPSCHIIEDTGFMFLWYFGFWFLSVDGNTESGVASDFFVNPYDDKYMTIGIITIVLLILALIFMFSSSKNVKNEKNFKISAGTSLIGGILALSGPIAYYSYLKEEFANFWLAFDESFGFFLPIIAGILGIIGAIAAGYEYTLERKVPLKPTVDTGITPQISVPSPQEGKRFCANCGAELLGPFCRECGQKAE